MRNFMNFDKIEESNFRLSVKIAAQEGFITLDDVDPLCKIAEENGISLMVLVRTNMGRFLTPVCHVRHYVGLIKKHADMITAHTGQVLNEGTDWVRDISLPAPPA